MNIKNIVFILFFIKIINCIKINFVNYDIFPLLIQTNVINKNNYFKFLIDTGSPYTWISGVKSKYHDHYNINNTNLKSQAEINVTYSGDAQIRFLIYNTSFYINNKSINNVPLGITFNESDSFSIRNFDGILGLGGIWGNITSINYLMKYILTYNMVKQKIIERNMFSLYINTTKGEYNHLNIYGNELNFGSIDKSKYNKNINCYEIYNENNNIYYYWSLKLNKIEINNSTININNKIQLDSGNSHIAFKKDIFDIINKQIESVYDKTTGLYIINNKISLKSITFYFNNDQYILNPNDYTYDFNNKTYSRIIYNKYGNYLGLPFLQKYYSVYDFDNKTICLAEDI